eukprot:TRINITY_DN1139_c0_g2_i2.p2 TRINITY_DN1139_c0_g2~~TRINITY_DN1139_c0_g2_i2.p2  ORF type:complete len:118 (-),score=8.94 TRINITY_DN1139_c0_g2_i2:46-399(-)
MLGFMGNIRAKIPSNNAMPRGVILLIKFFLNESCNIFFNIEFFKGLVGTVHCIALHVFSHVCIFYYCFSVSHSHVPVSYTHLTLPTKRIVQISVVAVSLEKKNRMHQIHRLHNINRR